MAMKKRFYSVNGQMMACESGGVKKDFITDHLGSITAEMDQSQTRTYDARYSAYGKSLWSTGSNSGFGWVGSYGYRETGLSHMSHYVRARHYSYATGGWSTVDPLWPDESAYGYALSWPTYWIDPSGLNGTEVKPPPDLRYPPVKGFPAEPRPLPKPITGGIPKPGITPRPGVLPKGGAGAVTIIAFGVQACVELYNYCNTGETGDFTGLGDAIGKACFDPVPDPPGTRDKSCSDALLASLTAAMEAACKIKNQKYACKDGMSINEMKDMYKLNMACARARRNREARCWNGGDPTHKCEIFNAIQRAKCCQFFISGGKGKCPHKAKDCGKV